MDLKALYAPIQPVLDEAASVIAAFWAEAHRLVGSNEMGQRPPGGKMLRPALCLLSAGAMGEKNLHGYASLAAAFEALHIASLAHDDVIDKAILRRGTTSLNALWDNHTAVLGGDYLVARSVELLCGYGSCEVIANAISSVRRMAEGELFFFGRADEDITPEDCLRLAEQKTAALFAEACSAPACLLDGCKRNALHGFGTSLGIAFQIIDDLLDLTQPTSQLGKPSCGDIVEGKRTLPILYMRGAMSASEITRLDAMRGADLSFEEREWAMAMVERTGAREKTEAEARRHADAALEQLEALPPSEYRDSMAGIVEYVVQRNS